MREDTLFHILIALVTILVGSSSQADSRTNLGRALQGQRTLSISPLTPKCECDDCFSIDFEQHSLPATRHEELFAPRNLGPVELNCRHSFGLANYYKLPHSRGPPLS